MSSWRWALRPRASTSAPRTASRSRLLFLLLSPATPRPFTCRRSRASRRRLARTPGVVESSPAHSAEDRARPAATRRRPTRRGGGERMSRSRAPRARRSSRPTSSARRRSRTWSSESWRGSRASTARLLGPHPAARASRSRDSSPSSSRAASRSSARASSTISTRCRPTCAASASSTICRLPVAAFVVTKGQAVPEDLARECRARDVPLLVSDQTTSVVIQSITRVLEDELAPTTTVHGVLVDVYGMGVLLLGDSGHRQERVRARPHPARPPPRRRRRRRDPQVPERLARRPRGRDDPVPHGAARPRHHQHQAPLRRLRGAGVEVDRARDRAAALGRPASTTGSGSTARPTRSSSVRARS